MSWLLVASTVLALGAAPGETGATTPASTPPPSPTLQGEPPPIPTLDELLDAIGAEVLRTEKSLCKYTEHTVLEELDRKGSRKGAVVREMLVTQAPDGPSRALRHEEIDGDPSALFTRRPEEKGEKPKPGPFHPSQRELYEYTLEVKAGGQTATVRFRPRKPHADRMQGHAVVDLLGRKLVRLSLEPSKYPPFLEQLRMHVTMRDTPCGRHPSSVVSEGVAGIMFVKSRFRAETKLSAHALAR